MSKNFYNDILIKKRKSTFKTISLIGLVLLCVFSVGVLADLFSTVLTTGNFSFSVFKGNSYVIPNKTLYAVTMGVSEDKFRAYTIAGGASSLGAGGYVWFENNKYTVIANIYKTKEDANKVVQNISNANYEVGVFEINLNKIDVEGLFKEDVDKELYFDSLNKLYNLYLDLYDMSNNIDTKNITFIQASSLVNGYKSDCKIINGKLNELKSRNNENFVSNICNTYVHIIEILDSLVYKLLENNQSTFVVKNALSEVVYKMYQLHKSM